MTSKRPPSTLHMAGLTQSQRQNHKYAWQSVLTALAQALN